MSGVICATNFEPIPIVAFGKEVDLDENVTEMYLRAIGVR
jgi:hypothetical protein